MDSNEAPVGRSLTLQRQAEDWRRTEEDNTTDTPRPSQRTRERGKAQSSDSGLGWTEILLSRCSSTLWAVLAIQRTQLLPVITVLR